MTFENLINTFISHSSNKSSCVITSRIRLARNLSEAPFPGWAKKEERKKTYATLAKALKEIAPSKSYFEELVNLESLQKQVLVEQHLMSRELAARGEGCGIAVNKDKSLSVMLNEEDHFRLQAIQPGLSLKKAYRALSKMDDSLSESLSFAYDEKLGYLTSCPSNVGTGMRASVMLHLPALYISDQITPVLKAVSKLGLAIRGFYGEGTESLGHLYQISNQSTLGESEIEIITRVERMAKQVVGAEENARKKVLSDNPQQLIDKVGRAYGILKHASIISSKEALNLLSILRLGSEVGYFPTDTLDLFDKLMIQIQPAHLQLNAGGKLEIEKRDEIRAETISSHLQNLYPPDSICNKHEVKSNETDSLLKDS